MTDLNSRPYHPDPKQCCEACVFGHGIHAFWCDRSPADERTIREILTAAGL